MEFLLLQADIPKTFDFMEIVMELLRNLANALPSFIGAILVFFLGWLISKGVSRLLKRLLKTIGVDKLAEKLNDIELISQTRFRIVPSELLSKVIYYLLLLIFIIAATDVLGMPAVSNLMSDIINYVPNLLTAGIVLIIGVLFADFIKKIVLTACESLAIPSAGIIANFIFYFIFIAVAMSALSQAKINTEFIQDNLTVLVAGAALAFAIGYGFASKDMMANFVASFYSKDKVRVGDEVKIGEVHGRILYMDNNSMTIKTSTSIVLVPLSKLTSENVEKFSEWLPPPLLEEEE